MAKIIENKDIFFNGMNIQLIKGNELDDKSPIVVKFPELFEVVEVKKPKKIKKVEKVEEPVEKKEEPKEELLIEEPVAALEVEIEEKVEEKIEEVQEEVKPKRRRSRK